MYSPPSPAPALCRQMQFNLPAFLIFVSLLAHSGSAAIDFVKDVQPILETNCLSCHSGKNTESDFDLSTRSTAFSSGSNGPAIVPNKPQDSPLYTRTIVPTDDSTLMPPSKQGGPLDKSSVETLRQWIAEGVDWPKDITLKTREKKSASTPNSDDLALVRKIHTQILERAKSES